MVVEPRVTQLGLTREVFPAGTHLCHIFNDNEERCEAITGFLRAGLSAGERATCLLSDRLDPATLAAYLGRHDLSLDTLLADGTLALREARGVYFKEGRFDPDQPLALMTQFQEAALAAGCSARLIGELCPEVGQIEGGRPLVEYERRVGEFLQEKRLMAVCQYDAAAFDGATIMDVLSVHPVMMLRGEVIHNPFFLASGGLSQGPADARALAQILLIESLLPNLPNRLSMLRFVVRGLEGLPGVQRAWFQEGAAKDQGGAHSFDIRTNGYCHAVLHLDVTDEALYSLYAPYLKNLAFMFGVILNERRQRDENERTLANLEALVAARTAALVESERRQAESRQLESLGRLAGGVAHDMNNVLGAILALASYDLDACPALSPLHSDLDTIAKAAERGGHMVKSLLAFARQAPLAEAEVDLNAVLQEVVRLLERTTPARIRLVSELEPRLRPMRGDAHALTSAVMNLCINAVDAMADGGTLTLSTRNAAGGGIELQVQDTGSGMTPEVQRRAMEPFFTTKELGEGTGLGLAMVYGTVQAHQGQMTLQSELGTGTCVTLAFPACPSAAPSPSPRPEPRRPAVESAHRVLVVDDDPLVRSATLALLGRLGHQTTAAAGGEEALAQFEQGFRPEVVILDLNMPGLSGAETLARLRALDPKVPVVLATGSPDHAAHELLASYAEVSLLAKPYTIADLRNQVAAVTRGR